MRIPLVLATLVLLAQGAGGADPAQLVAQLHREALVVDTHEDVPTALEEHPADLARLGATPHVDIPRLKQGGLGAVFFAVYVPASRAENGTAAHAALEQADLVARVVADHPADLAAATSVAEIRAARRAGKIAVLTGVEGGHAIEGSLAVLRQLHRLGVRYLTLTHTNTNEWADSSGNYLEPEESARARRHHGLTALGRRVIAEMNRLGVAVDVSHASDETIAQALAVSRAPIFASHSSCRALTDMSRNLTDDQIRAIAKRGGVVMINVSSAFVDAHALAEWRRMHAALRPRVAEIRARLAADPVQRDQEIDKLYAGLARPRASLSAVADHIEHALALAPGAVGLGTDFDGIEDPPRDLPDVAALPQLTAELLRRGHTPDEVRGILGENFLAYLERVEAAAAVLRAQPPPAEAVEVDPPAAIEAAIARAMTAQHIPGLSVAVGVRGQVLYAGGFGAADLENGVPATADTVYLLASVSKTITAVAALQLAAAGKLDLDAPVQTYVPDFPKKQWTITARQLLGHRAGIRHYRDDEPEVTRHYERFSDALDMFANDPLRFQPGTAYEYSSFGYNLLGAVIERAAGGSYVDYVRAHIAGPSGALTLAPDDVRALVPHRAQGYQRSAEGLRNAELADSSFKMPSGGLSASAPDLVRYALALLDGRLLPAEARKRMWTESPPNPDHYALGWMVTSSGGKREVWHTGSQPRVSTVLYLQPEHGLAVALLCNLEGAKLTGLAREIAALARPLTSRR
jgi:membrane dipeptidase